MALSSQERDVGFEQWLRSINAACGRFAAKTLGAEFSGTMQEFRSHALRLSIVDVAQASLYRTRREIAQSDGGHFFTVFQLRGSALMTQGGQQSLLTAGDVTLIDASRPCHFSFQQDSRQISLLLPRRYLEQPLRVAEVQCAKRIGADNAVVQLSYQLVAECIKHPAMSAAESEAVLNAIATLLRPTLTSHDNGADVHQPLFNKALALIDRHIQSELLRPEWLAAEVGVSVRSLYRLFARRGLVVAQYIKHRRLDLCAQALRNAPERQKLAGLGYDWGFSDHSHFSTAFKQRFGVSPSDYRKQYQ
ncbi:TPA: transcriptional regulator FeaR [Serratia odorifera]|nr:transcriptional regulator FeaR [Serratia odorifera]